MPAPSTMHFYRCTDFADPKVYADAETFFADLAKIYRQEIADLAKAGCRYIQLDEVAIAMLCDPAIRDQVAGAGPEPRPPGRSLHQGHQRLRRRRAGRHGDRRAHVPRQFPRPLPVRGRL